MLISICISTYKRREKLRNLLQSINEQAFTKVDCPDIEVIVVDNHNEGDAAEVCSEIKPGFRWQLKAGVEPQRGITYARNRSVALASPEADFIIFVDDDEVATSSWIENLLLSQEKYGADVVGGPNLPSFVEDDVPEWVVKGGFFIPSRWETGTEVSVLWTNNVLVRASILRQMDPVFDNRFALIGGEDSYLFLSLHKAGYKLIWADNAIVHDSIPASRTNLKWILLRGYRTWGSYSYYEKEMNPSMITQIMRVVKGLALVAIGFLRSLPALFMGKAALVKALLSISRGMGTLGGLLGLQYQEYKNVKP